MFDALDFLAELTQHIPPKRLQLIRRYGLYASRTKGRWDEMPWVSHCRMATRKSTSMPAKAYEVDPCVCPNCGAEIKVIAIIEDPDEIKRIRQHMIKIGRAPPGFDPDRLN
jgi:hypothetical protein